MPATSSVLEVVGAVERGAPSIARKRATSRRTAASSRRVLAAGEDAVDGGPAAARLAGDVVEGGLGHAPAGDAAQGGVDDPLLLRRDRGLDQRHH